MGGGSGKQNGFFMAKDQLKKDSKQDFTKQHTHLKMLAANAAKA